MVGRMLQCRAYLIWGSREAMVDVLSIVTGWALIAMEVNPPRITVVNASKQVMVDVVMERLEKPSGTANQSSETIGTIPPGHQIQSTFKGSERLETVQIRFRTDDMENTLSCGPIEQGQRLILTNTDKGSSCDFK